MQTAQCRLVNSPNSSIYNHTTVSNESDDIVLRQNPFTYLPQLTLATHFRSTSCLQIWSLLQFNYGVRLASERLSKAGQHKTGLR